MSKDKNSLDETLGLDTKKKDEPSSGSTHSLEDIDPIFKESDSKKQHSDKPITLNEESNVLEGGTAGAAVGYAAEKILPKEIGRAHV